IGDAYLRWYLFATIGLVAFVLAATVVVAYVRVRHNLRRQRARDEPLTVAEIFHNSTGQMRGMAVVALVITLAAWARAGPLAYSGAIDGLRNVPSLADLVGTSYAAPRPVGPKVSGYVGAVIGDSRAARVGGAPVNGATPDDLACARSADSLAAEIGTLRGERV